MVRRRSGAAGKARVGRSGSRLFSYHRSQEGMARPPMRTVIWAPVFWEMVYRLSPALTVYVVQGFSPGALVRFTVLHVYQEFIWSLGTGFWARGGWGGTVRMGAESTVGRWQQPPRVPAPPSALSQPPSPSSTRAAGS